MATTTRVLDANVSGTVYTNDLNDALEAIDTAHAGTTAPTDEVANGKLWLDTSGAVHVLKVYRNGGWVPVVTNNSNTITVDYDNAKVGVGVASPTYRLDVAADANTVVRVNNGSSGGTPSTTHGEFVVESDDVNMGIQLLGTATSNQRISFGDPSADAAGAVTYDHTNNYMAFNTSNAEKVRVTAAGDVGIGTTSPSQKLEVNGTVKATGLNLNGTSVTATAAELNKLDGVTATTAELNKLDGVTATTAELNYTDGVTSNIQTQLNSKMSASSYPDLVAIESLSSTGIAVRTGSNTWAQRSVEGSNGISVTNGNGVGGDITVSSSLSLNVVGCYALCAVNTLNHNTVRSAGSSIEGSALNWANADGDRAGGVPTGTWRLMGAIPVASVTASKNTTVFLRIL